MKLGDFGIAKLASAEAAGDGATAGTPAYMSPEQTRGHAIDARTDLWSLGVLLYESLTGRRPFHGETDAIVVENIQTAEPDPIAVSRPDAPADLCRIVERCMRKDPVERYQSADDFSEALRRIEIENRRSDGGISPAMPGTGTRRYRWALVAVPAIVIAAAVWGGLNYAGREPARDVGGANAPPITVAVLPFANRDSVASEEHLVSGFARIGGRGCRRLAGLAAHRHRDHRRGYSGCMQGSAERPAPPNDPLTVRKSGPEHLALGHRGERQEAC